MVLAINTITRETPVGTVRVDLVTLPSGALVDLKNTNVSVCETRADAWELMQTLESKAIEIEHQLELFAAGFHRDGEAITTDDPADATWPARARRALKETRLSKANAQQRLQDIVTEEREKRRGSPFASTFVEVAQKELNANTFKAIRNRVLQLLGVPA